MLINDSPLLDWAHHTPKHSPTVFLGRAASGSLLWTFNSGSVIASSATVGDDGTVYFGAGRSLHAIGEAPPFAVNSANDVDDGMCDAIHCSFREAINAANANSDTNRIEFNIPSTGSRTIRPSSALPIITDPVMINGYTQTGASPNTNPPALRIDAVLKIELDGSNAGTSSGLIITAGNSTVKGLTINRFAGFGIVLVGTGGNVIEGNFIGTDVTGIADLGNGDNGIFIVDSPNNTIGGVTTGARNIISGNDFHGVSIAGTGSTGNLVLGNFIGIDINGTADLNNAILGVGIFEASNNIIGSVATANRNIISGNNLGGVGIIGTGAIGNLVLGNFIGTDVTGTSALPNSGDGVVIFDAPGNTIGGVATGARNIISGNAFNGIAIVGTGATGTLVLGNFIGIDVTGTATLANSGDGVIIFEAPNSDLTPKK